MYNNYIDPIMWYTVSLHLTVRDLMKLYVGDGNRNIWNTKRLLWAKQQLCMCITLFCTFLCYPCTTAMWNDRILSWLKNGKSKVINFILSLWILIQFLLFSSNLTFLLTCTSNWWFGTMYKGEIISKDTPLFSVAFSLVSPLSYR